MARLVREVSTHIRRAMTGVGRTTLASEIDSNRSIFRLASIFDKYISLKDLTKRFNEKLLTFDRFKSRVTEDGQYFEIIPNFDCLECMQEQIISESMISKYKSLHEFMKKHCLLLLIDHSLINTINHCGDRKPCLDRKVQGFHAMNGKCNKIHKYSFLILIVD
eukprot:175870_1